MATPRIKTFEHHPTSRRLAFLIALMRHAGEARACELYLLELLAHCSFGERTWSDDDDDEPVIPSS